MLQEISKQERRLSKSNKEMKERTNYVLSRNSCRYQELPELQMDC